jgi:hypothetical protein
MNNINFEEVVVGVWTSAHLNFIYCSALKSQSEMYETVNRSIKQRAILMQFIPAKLIQFFAWCVSV